MGAVFAQRRRGMRMSSRPPTSGPAQPAAPDAIPPVTVDLILHALRRSARSAGQDPGAARVLPEDAIPGYRLVRLLGRGGMAQVYEATHLRLRRPVALKLARPDPEGDGVGPRFLREARAMMQVRHENIITIHDAGTQAGWHYLALELVTGGDVGQLVERQGPLPLAEALRVVMACCEGLAAIHAAGLVHRDVKPGNLFLTADGQVKIGDFGLARQISGQDRMTA